MNILELSKPFNHGGVAGHITTLSVKLVDMGHNVIIASSYGNHISDLNAYGVEHKIIRFDTKNPQSTHHSSD